MSTSQAMMVTISSFIFIDGIPFRGWGGRKKKPKWSWSLFLPSLSSRRERVRICFSSANSTLSPADCCVVLCALVELLDSSLHWRAADSDAAAAAQTLSCPPPPLCLTLTSLPSSRSSFLRHYSARRTGHGHCRIHGPVYSAFFFSYIFLLVCFVFAEMLEKQNACCGNLYMAYQQHPCPRLTLHSSREPACDLAVMSFFCIDNEHNRCHRGWT